jgi:hypothetical protein
MWASTLHIIGMLSLLFSPSHVGGETRDAVGAGRAAGEIRA